MLALASVVYVALALYLTRSTTLYIDEVNFFVTSHGFDPESLLAPWNGHLIAVPRAIYAASFGLFGAAYLPLRIVEVTGVVVVAWLFYVLARRRIGTVALAPALILLFFGSSWEVTLSPLGIQNVWVVAAGLGALLLLERGDRRGDVGACLLLIVAVAMFSVGLAFLVAAGVAVALRPDRLRRSWILVIPLVLYGAWLVAKPSLETSLAGLEAAAHASNIPHAPEFMANSAAAVLAAFTGINYSSDGAPGLPPPNADPALGMVIAALALVALIIRLLRGPLHPSLLTAIAFLLALWTSYALAADSLTRTPEQPRYLFTGAVAVLLVVVEAVRGYRLPRVAVVAAVAVTGLSVAVGVAHFVQARTWLRNYSDGVRAQLAAVEIAADSVDPEYSPTAGYTTILTFDAGASLSAVERIGSPAFTASELEAQSEIRRQGADRTLAAALGIELTSLPSDLHGRSCRRLPASEDGTADFTVAPPGTIIRSAHPGEVTISRFADQAAVSAGSLVANRPELLTIPADRYPEPWHAVVEADDESTIICEPPA